MNLDVTQSREKKEITKSNFFFLNILKLKYLYKLHKKKSMDSGRP